MQKITLKIQGMHCASCVANIEKNLKKKEGVIRVGVNFASEKASIEFNPEKIKLSKIKEIIKDMNLLVSQRIGGIFLQSAIRLPTTISTSG